MCGLAVQARTGDGIETIQPDGSTAIRDPGSAAFDQVYHRENGQQVGVQTLSINPEDLTYRDSESALYYEGARKTAEAVMAAAGVPRHHWPYMLGQTDQEPVDFQ